MVASAFLRRESPQVELRWIESKNSLAETVGEGSIELSLANHRPLCSPAVASGRFGDL
jgi:hypothetical protein